MDKTEFQLMTIVNVAKSLYRLEQNLIDLSAKIKAIPTALDTGISDELYGYYQIEEFLKRIDKIKSHVLTIIALYGTIEADENCDK